MRPESGPDLAAEVSTNLSGTRWPCRASVWVTIKTLPPRSFGGTATPVSGAGVQVAFPAAVPGRLAHHQRLRLCDHQLCGRTVAAIPGPGVYHQRLERRRAAVEDRASLPAPRSRRHAWSAHRGDQDSNRVLAEAAKEYNISAETIAATVRKEFATREKARAENGHCEEPPAKLRKTGR
jgi:hypothetical protein